MWQNIIVFKGYTEGKKSMGQFKSGMGGRIAEQGTNSFELGCVVGMQRRDVRSAAVLLSIASIGKSWMWAR